MTTRVGIDDPQITTRPAPGDSQPHSGEENTHVTQS